MRALVAAESKGAGAVVSDRDPFEAHVMDVVRSAGGLASLRSDPSTKISEFMEFRIRRIVREEIANAKLAARGIKRDPPRPVKRGLQWVIRVRMANGDRPFVALGPHATTTADEARLAALEWHADQRRLGELYTTHVPDDAPPLPERFQPVKWPGSSGVYFVECLGRLKIGCAVNIFDRLSALQTSSPDELRLVAYMPTERPQPDELALHRRFRKLRLHGEWFAFKRELREFVAPINAQLRRADRKAIP